MELEKKQLSAYASLAQDAGGRVSEEEDCPLRTPFQRDRDRIIHSRSFRRLKQKTQVFLSPEGDHFRTRLTHTLEVSQIARTMARALRFNEDLTEAIALGHDLGHTPFGHAGERALNVLNPQGFSHNEQSVRVVEYLEKDHKGLNLTGKVREGIGRHTGKDWPSTPEGKLVRFADRIAYINHDIEDAKRAQVLCDEDLPKDIVDILGDSKSKRITTLIVSVVENTKDDDVAMAPDVYEAYLALHKFMFATVYVDPVAKSEEDKVEKLMSELYTQYKKHPEKLPPFYRVIVENSGADRAVTDYISGMTDNFAIKMFEELFVPKSWTL